VRPNLSKIGVVASTEFGSAVRTKSFVIGILLLPVIMGASILLQLVIAKRVDTKTRTFLRLARSDPAIRRWFWSSPTRFAAASSTPSS
jgi:hypothetical protein